MKKDIYGIYEDIGKMYRNILFSHEVKTYSELCSMFSEDINKAFKNIDIPSIQTEDSVEENKLITENTVGN